MTLRVNTRALTAGSLIGLALGLAVGMLAFESQNAALLRAAALLGPIGELWVNALRMIVLPLIVSHIVVAIAARSGLERAGRIAEAWLRLDPAGPSARTSIPFAVPAELLQRCAAEHRTRRRLRLRRRFYDRLAGFRIVRALRRLMQPAVTRLAPRTSSLPRPRAASRA